MTITVAQFKLRFPEFDTVPDARVQLFIDDSVLCFDPNMWGACLDLAQSYFVAANIQIYEVQVNDPSTSLPITDKTAGQLRVGMAGNALPVNDSDSLYTSNKYGQKYLSLRDKCIMGVLTVASGQLDIPIPVEYTG